jgi:GTPase SAR1 family protein
MDGLGTSLREITETMIVQNICVSSRIGDISDQEQYSLLIPMAIRNTEVGIAVYDLSNEKSFRTAQVRQTKLREPTNDGGRFV